MIYQISKTIKLKMNMDQAWSFFSNPNNLKIITPPSLNMLITSQGQDKMYPGMIINYKVHPILGIPLPWVTEITQVIENKYFVDEQRFGPYRMWHHQHLFKEIPGGVEARDIVDYIMPFGPLGSLVHSLFVSRQLNQIFEYRTKVLSEKFGLL